MTYTDTADGVNGEEPPATAHDEHKRESREMSLLPIILSSISTQFQFELAIFKIIKANVDCFKFVLFFQD